MINGNRFINYGRLIMKSRNFAILSMSLRTSQESDDRLSTKLRIRTFDYSHIKESRLTSDSIWELLGILDGRDMLIGHLPKTKK
jgi:hypothetical protein